MITQFGAFAKPSGCTPAATTPGWPSLNLPREKEDQRLLGLIKHAWLESGGVYGYRKIHDDLRELGEACGRNRVGRLMQAQGLRSQTGYRRRPGFYGGKQTVASPNHLARQFKVSEPNKVWVTDITYVRSYEGWLYLAVVLDLFSRQVIGWSMKPRMCSDLAIDAMLMAVWRRKPQQQVMIHSDSKNVMASVSGWSDSHSDGPMMDDLVVKCLGWSDPHSDRLCVFPWICRPTGNTAR